MRISNAATGVQSGSALIFSDYGDGGEMWVGKGDRLAIHDIMFDPPFDAPPVVHLSMNMWDTDMTANQRLDIRAADITATGFRIEFRTWGDSRIARVRAGWMAIGPVPYHDDWESES